MSTYFFIIWLDRKAEVSIFAFLLQDLLYDTIIILLINQEDTFNPFLFSKIQSNL